MENIYKKETEQLKKKLPNVLNSFEKCKGWADIGNWIHDMDKLLKQYKTPYLHHKILLAKRLAQCLNPSLDPGIHTKALNLYETIFENISLLKTHQVNGNNIENPSQAIQKDNNNSNDIDNSQKGSSSYNNEILTQNLNEKSNNSGGEGSQSSSIVVNEGESEFSSLIASDLAYFSIGLFPFYQYAAIKNKPVLLEIYIKYYFPLRSELIPCLPGLLVSILPGIEETNEVIQKKVVNTLDQLKESVGLKHFHGCIWMSILRVNKVRNAALRYLTDSLKLQLRKDTFKNKNNEQQIQDDSQIKESRKSNIDEDGEENEKQYQKQRSQTTAVLKNSSNIENQQQQKIAKSIEQSENNNKEQVEIEEGQSQQNNIIQINQNYFQKDPIETIKQDMKRHILLQENSSDKNELMYPNKAGLFLNAVLTSLECDNSLVKRNILDLLKIAFPFQQKNSPLQNSEKLILVQACMKLYQKKEHGTQSRIDQWFFGNNDDKSIEDYTPEIQDFIVQALVKIFEQASEQKEMKHFQDNQSIQDTVKPEVLYELSLTAPLKILQNFFMVNEVIIPSIIGRLSYPLIKFIMKYYNNPQFKEFQRSTDRLYLSIGSYSQQIILSLCEQFQQNIGKEQICLEVLNLIQFTFQSLIFDNEDIDLQYQINTIKPTLKQLIDFIIKHEIGEFFTLGYMQVCMSLLYDMVQKLQYNLASFEQYTENDEQFINNFTDYFNRVLEYFLKVSEDDEDPNLNLDMFSIISKSFNVLQKYKISQGKFEYKSIPTWLQGVIKCLSSDSPGANIISIESLIDIVVSAKAQECYSHLKVFFEDEDLIHVYNMFEVLWGFLDYHFQEKKIIDFIIIFQQEYPVIFREVIHREFEQNQDKAVQRYSTFFKQTNDFYRRNSMSNQGVGLIPMIYLLESPNPLIRQSCISWLSESSGNLFRVLDPLIETLIEAHKDAQIQFTESHSYVYTQTYDYTKVKQTFHLLQLIQDQLKNIFIQYIYQRNLTQKIINAIESSPYKSKIDISSCKYLNVLIFLILQFIQGQADENNENIDFKAQNAIINAKCCEYLLKMLEISDSIQISQEIMKNTFSSILTIMRNLINRKDYVMQVQILNLLRTMIVKINQIMQNNVLNGKQYQEQFLALKQQIGSQMFFENLLNGLVTANVHYVRARFINIITISIYLLSDYLEEAILNDNLKKIFQTFFNIINSVDMGKHDNQEDDKEDGNYGEQELKIMRDTIMVGENIQSNQNIFQKKKISFSDKSVASNGNSNNKKFGSGNDFSLPKFNNFNNNNNNGMDNLNSLTNSVIRKKHYSHAKIKANQFSQENFQEVINICDALKAVLSFFLKFQQPQNNMNNNGENNQNSQIQQQSIVLDVLTLSLLKQGTSDSKKKFQQTTHMIINLFPQMLLIYLHCWNLSHNFEHFKLFTDKGIPAYEFKNFKDFNHNLHEQLTKTGSLDIIKHHILEVIHPLSEKFLVPLINAKLVIWIQQCKKEFFDDALQNMTMYKEIELLITLNISPDDFFVALLDSPVVCSLAHFNQKRVQVKKMHYLYVQEYAEQENILMYFVYTYLSYNHLFKVSKDKLQKIWVSSLKFLQIFKNSHAYTIFWTLEILFLLSKKFSPTELMNEKSLRKEIHRFAKSQLNSIANIAAQKVKYVTSNDPKAVINEDNVKFKLLTPLTPTIYQSYLNYSEFLKCNEKQNELQDFNLEKIIFSPSKRFEDDSLTYSEFMSRISLIAFKTLKTLASDVLQNIYDQNERIVEVSKEFLLVIMPVMQDRNSTNRYHAESACELLHASLSASREHLVSELRRNLLDFFMRNEFFKCTKVSLRYWSDIINFTSDKGELLVELLNDNNFFPRIFTFSTDYDKKIKNLERICFIIYSGQKDQFQSRLKLLIDSMSEVIKDPDNAQPAILILMLFSVRILILRLSQDVLLELFRNIWPMLLTLLMQIFDKKSARRQNHNLTYAGLKLIEMISIVQMEEFYLHQWIFVFDYFGVRLEPLNSNGNMEEIDNNNNQASIQQINNQSKGSVITPFKYKTSISNSFPSTYQVDYMNQQFEEDIQLTIQKKKRSILLKEPLIQDEQELKLKVVFFCQYIININQMRLEVDHKELESVIEDDFIALDDYIFSIGSGKKDQ